MKTIIINKFPYTVSDKVFSKLKVFKPIAEHNLEGNYDISIDVDDEIVFDVLQLIDLYCKVDKKKLGHLSNLLIITNTKWTIKTIYQYIFCLDYLGVSNKLSDFMLTQNYIHNFDDFFDGIEEITYNDVVEEIINRCPLICKKTISRIINKIDTLKIEPSIKKKIIKKVLCTDSEFDFRIVIMNYDGMSVRKSSTIDTINKQAHNKYIPIVYDQILNKKISYKITLEENECNVLDVSKIFINNRELPIIKNRLKTGFGVDLEETIINDIVNILVEKIEI